MGMNLVKSGLMAASLAMLSPVTLCAQDLSDWMQANAVTLRSPEKADKPDLEWIDGALLTLEGKAFVDSSTSYSRLSVRHKADVTTDVWRNGQSAAGVTLRFVSDSPTLHAAWSEPKTAMGHMAWTGSGGLDLYSRQGNKWVFRGAAIPQKADAENLATLQKFPAEKKPTEYLLFLPLYSQVDKIEIGIEKGARISPAPDTYKGQNPIVFYGTSITQGGCASRAGMSHVGIIRRLLDYPVLNLGLSGSGKSEMAVSNVLAEIPASLYVLEPVQNMTVEQIDERMEPFVENLRKKQPDTPILMVESPNVWSQADKHEAWKRAYDKLKATGIDDLHYMKGDNMYRSVEDGTVDRTHPTDLGFYDMAKAYEPILREILGKSGANLESR